MPGETGQEAEKAKVERFNKAFLACGADKQLEKFLENLTKPKEASIYLFMGFKDLYEYGLQEGYEEAMEECPDCDNCDRIDPDNYEPQYNEGYL